MPESPEVGALLQHFESLVGGIQDPDPVADSAVSEGLISHSVYEEVTDHETGRRMKRNRILLLAVLNHVRQHPSRFDTFQSILQKDRAYQHLSKKLAAALRELRMASPRRAAKSDTVLFTSGMWFFIATIGVLLVGVVPLVLVQLLDTTDSNYTCTVPANDIWNKPVGEYIGETKHNSSAEVLTDLPVLNPSMPFVGRDRELAEIMSYLRSNTVYAIGIHGPPAFGKSTLAIHVGWEVVKFGISVRYVDVNDFSFFSHSTQGDQKSESDMHTYGLQRHKANLQEYTNAHLNSDFSANCKDELCSDLVRWASTLTSKHVLILDNCDTVLTATKDKFVQLVNELFQKSSYRYLSTVITSQTRVTFTKQTPKLYNISELTNEASLQLLQMIGPDITNEDGLKLAGLVGNCPLALKVIAQTLENSPGIGVLHVIDKLEKDVLRTISPAELSMEDRFEKVMDVAYSYLPSATKECVPYVHAFPGSFSEDAGRIILDSCGVESHECLETLKIRSLINHYSHGQEYRYQLHRLIKEYFQVIAPVHSYLDNFNTIFKDYYVERILDIYESGQDDDGLAQSHEILVELPNFVEVLIILCKHSADSTLLAAEVTVIVHAYIDHINTRCTHERIFSGIVNHSQAIEQKLGYRKYHSIYNDLLLHRYYECQGCQDFHQCRCTELCTAVFRMWFSQHSYIYLPFKEFSFSCFSCPNALVSAYFNLSLDTRKVVMMTLFTILFWNILCIANMILQCGCYKYNSKCLYMLLCAVLLVTINFALLMTFISLLLCSSVLLVVIPALLY